MINVIRLEQVTKFFGSTRALHNVTLRVPAGRVCGLLGENGAGKSTAIRLMLGLEVANCGDVEVLDLNSRTQYFAIRQRIGYVPERPVLYEWMTAAEIGWFASGFYPPGFEVRYSQFLTAFAVPPTKKIQSMSKGMRAKIALALAQAHDPELLILDEPTSGIDVLVRHEFLDSMVDLTSKGRTVFFSSHQIAEVERVADMIAIMRAGEILVYEPLEELKFAVREITVSSDAQPRLPPEVGGLMLSSRQNGHQWQMVVRNPDQQRLDALDKLPGIIAVDTRRMSLEEIYVAYIRSEATVPSPQPLEEAPIP